MNIHRNLLDVAWPGVRNKNRNLFKTVKKSNLITTYGQPIYALCSGSRSSCMLRGFRSFDKT